MNSFRLVEFMFHLGYNWGAVLIAGNHSDRKTAEGFKEDVKEVKKVITSKYPLVMGIR